MSRRSTQRQIDLALYLHGIRPEPLCNRLFQHGGNRPVKCGRPKSGIVIGDGFRYKYTCHENDEKTLIFNGGNNRPCFVLAIEPETKTAALITLEQSKTCSMDIGATTVAAGKAAFELARQRGVKRIELTDNALKSVNPSGDKMVVSDMEFLTQGRTWYETFLPVTPPINLEDERRIARTNTWAKVFACLQHHHPDITIPVDITDIDTERQGSAMEVFIRIKAERSDFFAKYRYSIMKCSDIPSKYGMVWTAVLP